MQNRREFLTDSTKTVLALALAPLTAAASQRHSARGAALDYLTFSKLVRTPFYAVNGSKDPAELILIKAEAHPGSKRGKSFALMFRGVHETNLEQGTYRFAHATLRDFEMFIVPKPADHHGRYFEAVFNRLA